MGTLTVFISALCVLLGVVVNVEGLIDGLYCGQLSCYEVLEIERGADKAEIGRAYRKFAVKYHPDKYKGSDAHEKFQLATTAYEILKDDEERANYDYMLDNPDEVLQHYYKYYKRRVSPKVDVRVVILVTIAVISVIQYISWMHSYNYAISAALRMPQYRMKAKNLATEQGLLTGEKKKGVSKEEQKASDEAILRSILEQNLSIIGGYRRPRIQDVLCFMILLSPYYLYDYVTWRVRWFWRFSHLKQDYGPEELAYLTRKKLSLSAAMWEALDEARRGELVDRKLWIEENYITYKSEQDEINRVKMAESSKHKMMRRYLKNHKPSFSVYDEECED
ncbi:hypothetical protein EMCRGX_G023636 [Ephydatia muelleri]